MNDEIWYYTYRATPITSIYQAEDIFNSSSTTIFKSTPNDTIIVTLNGTVYNFVPVISQSYTVLITAKIIAITNGTLQLTISSTSSNSIVVYLMQNTTAVSMNTLTFNHSICTISFAFASNTEYTVVITQSNTTTTNTVFIQSEYTGSRVPRHNPYIGNASDSANGNSGSGSSGVSVGLGSSLVSVGDYKTSARTADFDGWLLCDGRAVFRDAYPALYAVIQGSFGNGDGVTTFNLPDGRGRVSGFVGQGTSLSLRNLGNSVGEENHVLSSGEIPAHSHTGTTSTVAAHTHTYQDAYFSEFGGNKPNGSVYGTSANTDGDNGFYYRAANGSYSTTPQDLASGAAGGHSHTFTTGNTGGNNSHNNMQPTLFVGNLFICAEI